MTLVAAAVASLLGWATIDRASLNSLQATADETMVVSDDECPATNATVAAGMRLRAVVESSCSDLLDEVATRVESSAAGTYHDPSGGKYEPVDVEIEHVDGSNDTEVESGVIDTVRVNVNKNSTTSQRFIFKRSGVAMCEVSACSRNQFEQAEDDGQNYCALKMMLCGSYDGCAYAKTDIKVVAEQTMPFESAVADIEKCVDITGTVFASPAPEAVMGSPAPDAAIGSQTAKNWKDLADASDLLKQFVSEAKPRLKEGMDQASKAGWSSDALKAAQRVHDAFSDMEIFISHERQNADLLKDDAPY